MSLLPTKKKQYGLIVSKKSKVNVSVQKPSAFDDDSSDEDLQTGGKKSGKVSLSSLWRKDRKNLVQMESHGTVMKALEEDPNIFDYDGQYDKMQEERIKSDPRLMKKDKNSKYIAKLKKVADRRKLEQDIIYERKVQREMEQEGKEYGDKDTFLTSSYRRTLEERRKLEEELKIAARKEEMEDVTKQVDISRFHRTLLNRMTEKVDVGEAMPNEADEGDERKEEERGVVEEEEEEGRTHSENGQSRSSVDLEEDGREMQSVDEDAQAEKDLESTPAEERSESRTSELETAAISAPAADDDVSLFPPTVDKEKRRKEAAVKRANEESLQSARERYLARKKAKLTAPVISDD